MILLEVVTHLDEYTHTQRLQAGADAQRRVRDELRTRFGSELKRIRLARVGSKLFDIEATIAGTPVRVEVKSLTTDKPYFAFFDTYVFEGQRNTFLDALTEKATKGKYTSFSDAVSKEKGGGFPTMPTLVNRQPDVPKSGRIPALLKNINDRSVLDWVYAELLSDLAHKQINYLALYNRSNDQIAFYHISGEDAMHAPALPHFRLIHLDTYGAPTPDQAMRVVVRIAL